MNVGLTRAKYGLVILGNPRSLSKNILWNHLLLHFREKGCLVEGTLDNLQSVSYTHLDVYKRQSHNRAQIRSALFLHTVASTRRGYFLLAVDPVADGSARKWTERFSEHKLRPQVSGLTFLTGAPPCFLPPPHSLHPSLYTDAADGKKSRRGSERVRDAPSINGNPMGTTVSPRTPPGSLD